MNDIVLTNDSLSLQSERLICETLTKLNELKETEKLLKAELLQEMKKRGLVKIDTPKVTVTYIGETQSEKFNSKKFREENPDLYDKYVYFSNVTDCVKVSVKNGD